MLSGAPVLIIDDDAALTEMLKGILEAAGHATAVAHNPFQGLKLAREVQPSAVVCDLKMPLMTGTDVLRTLASDPATADIPRVLMTGQPEADRSCAHGFLLKPFQASDLLGILTRMTAVRAANALPAARRRARTYGDGPFAY